MNVGRGGKVGKVGPGKGGLVKVGLGGNVGKVGPGKGGLVKVGRGGRGNGGRW